MYLALSAVWNVSLVASILNGVHGTKALALALSYSRGNKWQGLRLMLVFFAWGLSLRLLCLYFGMHEKENGIIAQISLFCLGNVLKCGLSACLTLLQKLPVDYQPSLIYEAIDLLRSLSDHAVTLNVTIKIIEIYLFNLVNFLIVLTTIHAASSIYTSNVRPLVPSCCPPRHFRLVQSGCPTRHSRLSGLAMHWIVYGVAIAKWLEHSVRWNLSVVVSILEEKRGLFEAITASSELSKGKMLRGWLFFMLLFSVGRFN
ncbi:hypothetical protein ACFX11_021399 [Malus domestica]